MMHPIIAYSERTIHCHSFWFLPCIALSQEVQLCHVKQKSMLSCYKANKPTVGLHYRLYAVPLIPLICGRPAIQMPIARSVQEPKAAWHDHPKQFYAHRVSYQTTLPDPHRLL